METEQESEVNLGLVVVRVCRQRKEDPESLLGLLCCFYNGEIITTGFTTDVRTRTTTIIMSIHLYVCV